MRLSISPPRLALAVLLLLLFSILLVWRQYRLVACNRAIVALEEQGREKRETVFQLQRQVQCLQDRKRLEELARKECGLVYPRTDQVFYLEKAPVHAGPASLRKFLNKMVEGNN